MTPAGQGGRRRGGWGVLHHQHRGPWGARCACSPAAAVSLARW